MCLTVFGNKYVDVMYISLSTYMNFVFSYSCSAFVLLIDHAINFAEVILLHRVPDFLFWYRC